VFLPGTHAKILTIFFCLIRTLKVFRACLLFLEIIKEIPGHLDRSLGLGQMSNLILHVPNLKKKFSQKQKAVPEHGH